MTTGRINQVAAYIDRAMAMFPKPAPVNIRASTKAGLDRLICCASDRLTGQKLPSRSQCTSIPGGASASG